MSSKETTQECEQAKIKVLCITPRMPTSDKPGSMAPALRQIDSLRRLGIEVIVQDMKGIPVVKYGPAVPRMWTKLDQVDLIHAHFGYCGWIARMQWRRPVVVSFMGDDLLGTPTGSGSLTLLSRFMVNCNRLLARRVDQVIVKSREMAQVISPTSCHIIPNGVDLDLFRPMAKDEAKSRLGLDSKKRYILFPGDPSNPRKGYRLAWAATEETRRLTGLPIEILTLWGRQPDEVPWCMNACEAMWMTSLIEGSPNVVKEAMGCNLSVVGVPVGDVAELLSGLQGYFVCERDPQQLAKAMANVLQAKTKVHGREGLIQLGLSMEQVALRIRNVYLRALARSHHSTLLNLRSNLDGPSECDGISKTDSSTVTVEAQ
jgi:glycosyltransferase involved in cell wall biosynthesis